MKERLQKVLAARGVASRRAAEDLIVQGSVRVNGEQAVLGQQVDPETDRIEVRGQMVAPIKTEHTYLLLHKPVGYVSSRRSTHGELTVMELVPNVSALFPVGRLDKDTSGLLLLSDDGQWANIVTHPRYEVEKQYEAEVHGTPGPHTLKALRWGVPLPDGSVTAPAEVEVLGRTREGGRVSVTVIEGKKRQIRLMLAAVGHPVISLRRVRVGPITLGDLPAGRWRPLQRVEVEAIRQHAKRSARSRS